MYDFIVGLRGAHEKPDFAGGDYREIVAEFQGSLVLVVIDPPADGEPRELTLAKDRLDKGDNVIA